ncbi:flagellar basal body-associated protein FliL [Geomicrobium halophilum]|uniref:Flagellar basal body-associated protein FliL n=1 Tax=Geomicrobium halophilum TaxID=549000 RepID=A0A841Q0R7_9BACL|nr:flagellar basal body-associated protein FliL [Geomicrobium halophilum]
MQNKKNKIWFIVIVFIVLLYGGIYWYVVLSQ